MSDSLDPQAIARRLDVLAAELQQLAEALIVLPRAEQPYGANETEAVLLDVLAGAAVPLPGPVLAAKLDKPHDSLLRRILSGLKKKGLVLHVDRPRPGYWLASRELPAAPASSSPLSRRRGGPRGPYRTGGEEPGRAPDVLVNKPMADALLGGPGREETPFTDEEIGGRLARARNGEIKGGVAS